MQVAGGNIFEFKIDSWDPFMEMQFYVTCWTIAGESAPSEILEVTAIDYCDDTDPNQSCDFEDFFGDDAEEFSEAPYGWIGGEVSETVYHLEWDAPYDPYGFWGTPLGYVIYADNFEQGGRGEQWRAIARVEGSQEYANSWMMDVEMDMMIQSCTPAPGQE